MTDPRSRWMILGVLVAGLGCQGLSSTTTTTGAASLAGMVASEEVPTLGSGVMPLSGGQAAEAGAAALPLGPRTASPGPTLPALAPRPQEGRMLLKTGAIQLGPGVGHNLWGWQGDGLGGF